MTELEQQLMSALAQLQSDYDKRENDLMAFFDEREKQLTTKINTLTTQVERLAEQQQTLIKHYNTVAELLSEELKR